jgi:hypothetical protein
MIVLDLCHPAIFFAIFYVLPEIWQWPEHHSGGFDFLRQTGMFLRFPLASFGFHRGHAGSLP